MNVVGGKVVDKAQDESTGGQPDDVIRKRADDAAVGGILLLTRIRALLNLDPPDLRCALAECQAAALEDSKNPE
jgi:hypothetical protein